jgi:hypothetical protein
MNIINKNINKNKVNYTTYFLTKNLIQSIAELKQIIFRKNNILIFKIQFLINLPSRIRIIYICLILFLERLQYIAKISIKIITHNISRIFKIYQLRKVNIIIIQKIRNTFSNKEL